MPGLLILAHAPLASSLKAVAEHAFPGLRPPARRARRPAAAAGRGGRGAGAGAARAGEEPEALILTDVFGATPCNIAQRLADGVQVKVGRRRQRADALALALLQRRHAGCGGRRARRGATQGVMPVATSRPQNQTLKARGSDQGDHEGSITSSACTPRASAKLTKLAGGFRSEIHLARNGRRVNAKSIMG
jgi:PTS system ascorbate-specific IIA component